MSGGFAQIAPPREGSRGRISLVRVSQRDNPRTEAFGLWHQLRIDQSQRCCGGVMLCKLTRRLHFRAYRDALELTDCRFDLFQSNRTGAKQSGARLQGHDRRLDAVCRCAAIENEIDAVAK